MRMQALIAAVYPPQCLSCGALVASNFGLCADCWRDTPFITGLVCDLCGLPLAGNSEEDEGALCDSCLRYPPPWRKGRAALLYEGQAKTLILGLKHADRMDLVRPAARWMYEAGRPLYSPDMLVVPVPLHRWRLFRRRYNQAALLGAAVARLAGLPYCPDALLRPKSTASQEGRDRAARFSHMEGAFRAHPRRKSELRGRSILIVDDVMTSGATFSAATDALFAAGARRVSVLALARVAKDW